MRSRRFRLYIILNYLNPRNSKICPKISLPPKYSSNGYSPTPIIFQTAKLNFEHKQPKSNSPAPIIFQTAKLNMNGHKLKDKPNGPTREQKIRLEASENWAICEQKIRLEASENWAHLDHFWGVFLGRGGPLLGGK